MIMNILLKCPTRSRPLKVMETLRTYMKLATDPRRIGVLISCDTDDSTMTSLVQEELLGILRPCAYKRICFGDNKSKIEACNADMDKVEWAWDIVVLVSDDMIPVVPGYDAVIRNSMTASFPDRDGILWFHDGYQGSNLNTLSIYGRPMYERLGHMYAPAYKSFFCDTELTDACRGELKDKTLYIDYPIIKHDHPGNTGQGNDALYVRNQARWSEDMYTYISRKRYEYDVSFLIPTMTGRESVLASLLASIHEKMAGQDLRYEIVVEYDGKEQTIGKKRNKLVQRARGKYIAFIDDDDEITSAYVRDLGATIRGGYSVMKLRGRIRDKTFIHDLRVSVHDPLAVGQVFQRPPNHLNPMLRDVASCLHFAEVNFMEDFHWSYRLASLGLLHTQYESGDEEPHYIYKWGADKPPLEPMLAFQATRTLAMNMGGGGLPPAVNTLMPPSPPEKTLRLGRNGFVSS